MFKFVLAITALNILAYGISAERIIFTRSNYTYNGSPPLGDPISPPPAISDLLSPWISRVAMVIILLGVAYWQREVVMRQAAPIFRTHRNASRPSRLEHQPDEEGGLELRTAHTYNPPPRAQPHQHDQGRADWAVSPIVQEVVGTGL